MEEQIEHTKPGRPTVPDEFKKRNRGVSMTDAEYVELKRQAKEAGMGHSVYIIKKLKLS